MLNQTTKTRKSQQARELTIVAIYKFKTNGKLNGTRCTLVRNDKSEQLKVWTHTNGCASSCTCEGFEKSHGRRKCYHIKFVEAIEAASYDMRRCNSITPVAPRQVAQPVVKARELRNRFCLGEYTPQYRDTNGDWQDFKDGQGRSIFFLGGHEDLAREFIKVDSDKCRNAVLAELQRMFDEQNAAYEAEQVRKTAQSQRRVTAPLNGPRGFQLCKSWAEIEAERAAKKAVA